jgi:hypothetical protein
MLTKFKVLSAEGRNMDHSIDMAEFPRLRELRAIVEPQLGGAMMHHVRVLDPLPPPPHQIPPAHLDMFVDAAGWHKHLPLNEAATTLLRAAVISIRPDIDPDTQPSIYGPAVLFLRRVILPDPPRLTPSGYNNNNHFHH